MAPARAEVAALLGATVSHAPETPHEAAFHAQLAQPLDEAAAAFAKPPPPAWFDFGRAASAFEPLRALGAHVEALCRCGAASVGGSCRRAILCLPAGTCFLLPVMLEGLGSTYGFAFFDSKL